MMEEKGTIKESLRQKFKASKPWASARALRGPFFVGLHAQNGAMRPLFTIYSENP
jgi:hypothetical protein